MRFIRLGLILSILAISTLAYQRGNTVAVALGAYRVPRIEYVQPIHEPVLAVRVDAVRLRTKFLPEHMKASGSVVASLLS